MIKYNVCWKIMQVAFELLQVIGELNIIYRRYGYIKYPQTQIFYHLFFGICRGICLSEEKLRINCQLYDEQLE